MGLARVGLTLEGKGQGRPTVRVRVEISEILKTLGTLQIPLYLTLKAKLLANM
jgi:hypothetical protein